jgi:hypothetical protein
MQDRPMSAIQAMFMGMVVVSFAGSHVESPIAGRINNAIHFTNPSIRWSGGIVNRNEPLIIPVGNQ